MSPCARSLALLALLALGSFDTAHGLQCYRCMSTNSSQPFVCNEFLSNAYDIEPESCDDVYDAKYCIKHVGRFEGGIGTKRFCSSVNLGNYCDYVKHTGDKLRYRTCVFTCDSNGCNPAAVILPSRVLNALLFIMTFGLIFVR